MGLVLVMVGLPARGKTYIARKLARYLSWLGYDTRVFNVGNYRRARLGAQQDAQFFDPGNAEGQRVRLELAVAALDDVLVWLKGERVAIYDATNSTKQRRNMVRTRLEADGHEVMFVESVCEDPKIIEANVRETKLSSPDYAGIAADDAVRDFLARIAHYERAYQPVDESDGSYLKLIDVGRKVVSHKIQGWLAGRIVFFLMNLHTIPRPIWLCRHGESEMNALGRIGGDSALSPRGREFSKNLGVWLDTYARGEDGVSVWTSTLNRTVETAAALSVKSRPNKALDEIAAGLYDGLTYDEIAARYPDESDARKHDKYTYRYPRGESYADVIQRLDPVIIELERQRQPVLVVAHQAVIRALIAYFLDHRPEECTRLEVPLHTVIELTPKAYGCAERRIWLGP